MYEDCSIEAGSSEWESATDWERMRSACVGHLYAYGSFLCEAYKKIYNGDHLFSDELPDGFENELEVPYNVIRACLVSGSVEMRKVVYSFFFEGVTSSDNARAQAEKSFPRDILPYWREYLENHAE